MNKLLNAAPNVEPANEEIFNSYIEIKFNHINKRAVISKNNKFNFEIYNVNSHAEIKTELLELVRLFDTNYRYN